MNRKIAIIGDRFMLPEVFRAEIEKACGDGLDIRTLEQPGRTSRWSTAMPSTGMDGLKEYFGDPDEIVDFIGDAEILVTQLAPLSDGMMERLPEPEAGRRVARRAGQHRHGGGARARHHAWSTRPAATPAPSPNSPSARSLPRRG